MSRNRGMFQNQSLVHSTLEFVQKWMGLIVQDIGCTVFTTQLIDVNHNIDVFGFDGMQMLFIRTSIDSIGKTSFSNHFTQFHRTIIVPVFTIEKDEKYVFISVTVDQESTEIQLTEHPSETQQRYHSTCSGLGTSILIVKFAAERASFGAYSSAGRWKRSLFSCRR